MHSNKMLLLASSVSLFLGVGIGLTADDRAPVRATEPVEVATVASAAAVDAEPSSAEQVGYITGQVFLKTMTDQAPGVCADSGITSPALCNKVLKASLTTQRDKVPVTLCSELEVDDRADCIIGARRAFDDEL